MINAADSVGQLQLNQIWLAWSLSRLSTLSYDVRTDKIVGNSSEKWETRLY
jgi:hypothetical protein